jgi:hypothetical protein
MHCHSKALCNAGCSRHREEPCDFHPLAERQFASRKRPESRDDAVHSELTKWLVSEGITDSGSSGQMEALPSNSQGGKPLRAIRDLERREGTKMNEQLNHIGKQTRLGNHN